MPSPLLVGVFLLLLIPLNRRAEFGGDEGFEFEKALLLTKHPESANLIWNDQPWLFTLVAEAGFQMLGVSPVVSRLFSLISFIALLFAIFRLGGGFPRLLQGVVVSLFLLTAYRTVLLATSAMIEFPAIAWGLVSAVFSVDWDRPSRPLRLLLCGLLFGCALQIKLTSLMVVPALVVLHCQVHGVRNALRSLLWMLAGGAMAYAVIALLSPSFSLDSLLGSHIRASQSIPDARQEDVRFHFRYFSDHAALLLAAGAGLMGMLRRRSADAVFALVFLCCGTFIAAFHRPWWEYYVIHLTIPLSILAGIGVLGLFRQATAPEASGGLNGQTYKSSPAAGILCAVVALAVVFTLPSFITTIQKQRMVGRLDEDAVTLGVKEYAPRARWVYTRRPWQAFFAGGSLPPEIAVLPLKRFWTGAINEPAILNCVKAYRPEVVVLGKTLEKSDPDWTTWVSKGYVLVDSTHDQELWVSEGLNPKKITHNHDAIKAFGL